MSYAEGVVRITGASATGLSGEQILATLTLTGERNAAAQLRVKSADVADPNGTPAVAIAEIASRGQSPPPLPSPQLAARD